MNISKKLCSFFLIALAAVSFAACGSANEADKTPADLVVYGKIFTSEGNKIVEAFAVKDGKYIGKARKHLSKQARPKLSIIREKVL